MMKRHDMAGERRRSKLAGGYGGAGVAGWPGLASAIKAKHFSAVAYALPLTYHYAASLWHLK